MSKSVKEKTSRNLWDLDGNFFIRLVVNSRTIVFLILHIERLKIFMSLVWKALYTRELKRTMAILEISTISNLTDFFYKQKRPVVETQSSHSDNSWFIVLMSLLVLIWWIKSWEKQSRWLQVYKSSQTDIVWLDKDIDFDVEKDEDMDNK